MTLFIGFFFPPLFPLSLREGPMFVYSVFLFSFLSLLFFFHLLLLKIPSMPLFFFFFPGDSFLTFMIPPSPVYRYANCSNLVFRATLLFMSTWCLLLTAPFLWLCSAPAGLGLVWRFEFGSYNQSSAGEGSNEGQRPKSPYRAV